MSKKNRKNKQKPKQSTTNVGGGGNPLGINIGQILGMAAGGVIGGWLGNKLAGTKGGSVNVPAFTGEAIDPLPKMGVYKKDVKLPDHVSDEYELAMMSSNELHILEAAKVLATQDIGPFARITLYPEVPPQKSDEETQEDIDNEIRELAKKGVPVNTAPILGAVARRHEGSQDVLRMKDHALIVHKDALAVALVVLAEKEFI